MVLMLRLSLPLIWRVPQPRPIECSTSNSRALTPAIGLLDCGLGADSLRVSRRCAAGLALWSDYTGTDHLQIEGGNHGQA